MEIITKEITGNKHYNINESIYRYKYGNIS